MTNTGGGTILIGINDDGTVSSFDNSSALSLDPAEITDKLFKYTGVQFDEFELSVDDYKKTKILIVKIDEANTPLVFSQPGEYLIDGKNKYAFQRGTVYFRHGAKSEPGNTNDLRLFLERKIERIKSSWFGNIKKIVRSPHNSEVRIISAQEKAPKGAKVVKYKITNSEKARPLAIADPNLTHVLRSRDVVEKINTKLKGKAKINVYDIQCIKFIFNIKGKKEFMFQPRFGSPQFTEGFVNWIMSQYEKEADFFERTREKYHYAH